MKDQVHNLVLQVVEKGFEEWAADKKRFVDAGESNTDATILACSFFETFEYGHHILNHKRETKHIVMQRLEELFDRWYSHTGSLYVPTEHDERVIEAAEECLATFDCTLDDCSTDDDVS